MFLEWSQPIEKVDDALRLVEASYERQASAFLIEARLLPADFFDLRTRFAGDFVQKLVNYGLRVAVVAPNAASHGERFAEFVAELVRNPVFRIFSERAPAEVWLGS